MAQSSEMVCMFFGTLGGSYLANRKSAALIAYRLEQLEQKVQAHNNLATIWTRASQMAQSSEMVCMLLIGSGPPLVNLVERTYKLEERTELQEEKIKVANHRIDDLEGFHKPA